MYEDDCHYGDQRLEYIGGSSHGRTVPGKSFCSLSRERREIDVRGTLAIRDLLDVFPDDVLGLLRHEN